MNYHNLTYPDMNNGNGLRVALWLSGCDHNCKNCQNPQTWDSDSGTLFNEAAKKELFEQLDKDYISGLTLTGGDPLHKNNLDAVLDLIIEFKKRYPQHTVREKNENHNILMKSEDKIRLLYGDTKSIWLYTGYYWEEIFEPSFTEQSEGWIEKYLIDCKKRKEIISKCDVMVDGRFVQELADINYEWAGSTNQSVIDIKKSLVNNNIVLWEDHLHEKNK